VADGRERGGRRIVVGIDGSTNSTAALEWAARQAELTGCTLEVITTWEWPVAFGVAFSYVPPDYNPSADAQQILDSSLVPTREAHPDLSIQTVVAEGHPAPILVEASRGADLLVVGSRGHGEFSGMLLGSVSEHCVTNASCPVLVFRDQD
jgi:nucleotide-binding universal stress UspA family protein